MTTLIPKYDQGSTSASNRPINLKLAETVKEIQNLKQEFDLYKTTHL